MAQYNLQIPLGVGNPTSTPGTYELSLLRYTFTCIDTGSTYVGPPDTNNAVITVTPAVVANYADDGTLVSAPSTISLSILDPEETIAPNSIIEIEYGGLYGYSILLYGAILPAPNTAEEVLGSQPVPFPLTLNLRPNTNELYNIPGWIQGSKKRAGFKRSLLAGLWLSYAETALQVRQSAIDLRNSDPTTWTGADDAEIAFLSRYQPDLVGNATLSIGQETGQQKLTRLLGLELFRSLPRKGTARLSSWALTTALGRGIIIADARQTPAVDTLIPELETSVLTTLSFNNTDPGTLILQESLITQGNLTPADDSDCIPLLSRQPARFLFGQPVGASRFSPFGRSASPSNYAANQITPIPTTKSWSDGTLTSKLSYVIKPSSSQIAWVGNTFEPGYRIVSTGQVIRPGTVPELEPLIGVQTSNPTVVQTPLRQRQQGNSTYRIPGDPYPASVLCHLDGKDRVPSWQDISEVSIKQGPPFDLEDTGYTPSYPDVENSYGTGSNSYTVVLLDHPLASDFS